MKKLALTGFALVLAAVLAAPAPLAAGAQLPAPEKLVLKNGITVYFLRNSDLPIVSFRMVVRGAGSAFEAAAAEGAANLAATLPCACAASSISTMPAVTAIVLSSSIGAI